MKRQADQYMAAGKYHLAIDIYQQYCPTKPTDYHAYHQLAYALFMINHYEEAVEHFKYVIDNFKRVEPVSIYYLAKCLHLSHQFKEAISYYKLFLSRADKKDPRRKQSIHDIKRCGNGLKLNFGQGESVIENMGNLVNSVNDELIPIESPNVPNRIYFSSLRSRGVVDEFDKRGKLVGSQIQQDGDMYATEIIQGAWSESMPLNPTLNTSAHEVLYEFNENGSVVFFHRSQKLFDNRIYLDTFQVEDTGTKGYLWQDHPFIAEEQIHGIFLFSDSIIMFSTDRIGGFGGYDLYISFLEDGTWSEARNLGVNVNTPFDEVAPFLARDGRTLYYSSNGIKSIGGFDVFRCRFDDQTGRWPSSKNVGMPLNSAGDELYYRISSNGQTGYFSSNREGSLGGLDIYFIHYRNAQKEHLKASIPTIFTQVENFKLFNEGLINETDDPEGMVSMKDFQLPSLLIREVDQILNTQNVSKLDHVIGLLKTYPHLIIQIESHSDDLFVSNFDLFYSIQRAEKIADYMVGKGVKASSIYLRALGGNYPIAKNVINGQLNRASQWYNRRIDFLIDKREQVPLNITHDYPKVNTAIRDTRFTTFLERKKGLTYRVQFAALTQMFKGDLINKYADSGIEKFASDPHLKYTSGLFPSFEGALEHLGKVKSEGFSDAFIVPYIEGIPVKKETILEEILQSYPDLRNYMLYSK
jgi:tetratricopeptide (TPR) repeat protein